MVDYYDLNVIISVGYRVKSQRGVEFRKWAINVLRQYIMQGYAVNHNRIRELGEVIRIMRRTQNRLDARQVLAVIERYSTALDLLVQFSGGGFSDWRGGILPRFSAHPLDCEQKFSNTC